MMEEDKEKFSHFNVVESLESIAAVQVAVYVCNHHELKREILCAPGLTYDTTKQNDYYRRKELWNNIIERKATVLLENLGLAKRLQEEVICIVLAVGMRMLTWAEYHEGTLNLPREYSINFLNSSFFTQGIIDNKKAAEELIKDESLKINQKYRLACLYFFTDLIPFFYNQLTKEEKKNLIKPGVTWDPRLVDFWSFYLIGEIDKLKRDKSLDEFRLKIAAEYGNKAVVEYCLEITNLSKKKEAIVDAAVTVVETMKKVKDDWIVFFDGKYDEDDRSVFWVPNDYYVDVLYFLLSKMGKDEKKEFLKKYTGNTNNRRECFFMSYAKHCRLLEYFLNWPYQNYFMKMAKLMMECLPNEDYALPENDFFKLLLKICDKIEPCSETNLKYGEEKSYDYRRLLREFWQESPERYKRHVLKAGLGFSTDYGLFTKYLKLKNFTREDGENIRLILASATDKEKETIICSRVGNDICIRLLKEEKLEILDLFVLNCFSSRVQADEFKRLFSFTEEVQSIIIDFVKCNKLDVAESFIKWSALPDEEKEQLKRDILAKGGKDACLYLISCNRVETVDKFLRWCFQSEGEVTEFKKELIFSESALFKCAELVTQNRIELVDDFVNLCLSCEEEITELKRKVGYRTSRSVLEKLISANSKEEIYNCYDGDEYFETGHANIFEGGKWEEVEQFMTWCFSSEQEIRAFKQSWLHPALGPTVHFNLIKCNKWNEAETFFAWLGLSPEEIKKLKKETLFYHDPAEEMFLKLMFRDEDDEEFEEFADYGSKEEAIELLLRWYLSDKEAVLEFKKKFKSIYCGQGTAKRKAVLKIFDLMIKQHLSDLDEEKMGVKRKSETSSSSKKLCNV